MLSFSLTHSLSYSFFLSPSLSPPLSPSLSLQGTHNHLIYQYGSDQGFTNVDSAVVRVWQRSNTNSGQPLCVHTLPVLYATQQSTCYGRFWNTFT